MNKFMSLISESVGGEILKKRADIIAQRTEREQRKLVENLQDEVKSKELELVELCDLSPKTTVDLDPGKEFNSAQWTARVQELKEDIHLAKLKLDLAQETYGEFFHEQDLQERK